jgi:hypothetical protein
LVFNSNFQNHCRLNVSLHRNGKYFYIQQKQGNIKRRSTKYVQKVADQDRKDLHRSFSALLEEILRDVNSREELQGPKCSTFCLPETSSRLHILSQRSHFIWLTTLFNLESYLNLGLYQTYLASFLICSHQQTS